MPAPPPNHVTNALSIEADAYVTLFKIQLVPSGLVTITAAQQVTWQGLEYESVVCQMTSVASYATEQVSRPRLEIGNPDAAYSPLVSQGSLEGALVTRYRVLRDDLLADRNIYISHMWKVARVAALTKHRVSLELRELGDGPNFVVPAQTFSPPVFPVVSLR